MATIVWRAEKVQHAQMGGVITVMRIVVVRREEGVERL